MSRTKAVRQLWLEFDDGMRIGSWGLPDPNDSDVSQAKAFIERSSDIGWHICYAISCGATGVKFHSGDMPEVKQ